MFTPGETNIICAPDKLAASLHFYCVVLGFEEIEREDGAVRLKLGGRHFLILPFAGQDALGFNYMQRPLISYDLLVEDLPAAVAHFEAHAVPLFKEFQPEDIAVTIEDPNGLFIEVIGSRA